MEKKKYNRAFEQINNEQKKIYNKTNIGSALQSKIITRNEN